MNTLGLFARYPEPGHTKTRLAAAIGDEAAADLYACFVQDLLRRTCTLADEQWLAMTPDTEPSREWFEQTRQSCGSSTCQLQVQPDGSLGERMAWFFREAARRNGGPVVLIGTDSPDLPSSRIRQAFQLLGKGEVDVVLGPAADGGYVLIGMTGDPGSMFEEIRWSSSQTLLDTLAAVRRTGRKSLLLPTWYDIDHVENLGTLTALQQDPGLTEAAACPITTACLQQLRIGQDDG